jgi:hypothetical protein
MKTKSATLREPIVYVIKSKTKSYRFLDGCSSPRNIHLLNLVHVLSIVPTNLGGLDRLKSCGGGPFEVLAMLVSVVLAILSFYNVASGHPWDRKVGKFSNIRRKIFS